MTKDEYATAFQKAMHEANNTYGTHWDEAFPMALENNGLKLSPTLVHEFCYMAPMPYVEHAYPHWYVVPA
jgi:hypothetical protein